MSGLYRSSIKNKESQIEIAFQRADYAEMMERQPGEESPLGLLLCAAGNGEQIQLLQLGDAGIQVSQYYTELPDKDLLKAQLQKQIAQAKLRLETHNDE